MEKLILFLKIIAWIGAISSTLFTGMCIYGTLTYPGSTEELLDKLNGKKVVYPAGKWLIIAIICWAFIIAF